MGMIPTLVTLYHGSAQMQMAPNTLKAEVSI